jgi:hypothetical protein
MPDGRRRITSNVRLPAREAVAHLAIDHVDGLDTFDDLPRDGRCVRDLWFSPRPAGRRDTTRSLRGSSHAVGAEGAHLAAAPH